MTRGVVLSEGRGLRVREYWPDASRGIPFPPLDEARGRLAYRAYASVKPAPSLTGVRSPPLQKASTPYNEPYGASCAMTEGSVFRGRHSVRPYLGTQLGLGNAVPRKGDAEGPWPTRDMPGTSLSQSTFLPQRASWHIGPRSGVLEL